MFCCCLTANIDSLHKNGMGIIIVPTHLQDNHKTQVSQKRIAFESLGVPVSLFRGKKSGLETNIPYI